ncbi:hypothetical protein MMT15_32125, partial [Escherichia coli]|nr:hypothetical protein [Escherichia coli]
KRRNEALDCLVYAYAALRVSVQRWQLDLAVLAKSREEETTRPTVVCVSSPITSNRKSMPLSRWKKCRR